MLHKKRTPDKRAIILGFTLLFPLYLPRASALAATTTVAAIDAFPPEKASADHTCEGVHDEVQINQALPAAGPGGKVILSSGTLYCNALTTIPSTTSPNREEVDDYE